MKRLWHFIFGHGKSYIEQHTFRMGQDSTGVLYHCTGCKERWFEWTSRVVGDFLIDMNYGTEDLLRYVGATRQEEKGS